MLTMLRGQPMVEVIVTGCPKSQRRLLALRTQIVEVKKRT